MSEINLSRFVDINIQYHEASTIASTRDVTVLAVKYGTLNTQKGPYSTLAEVAEDYAASTNAYKYAEIYFKNGGSKLLVLELGASATNTQALAAVKTLKAEYIVVAFDNVDLASYVAENYDGTGANQKLILTSDATVLQGSTAKNLFHKKSQVVGAAMTAAAYLSRIDFYGIDTVQDYNFTEEVITAEANDDAVLESVLQHDNNVDMTVAEKIINFGGNLTDGHDFVNQFSLIVLQQLLTNYIFALLTTKIKGAVGIASIQATVAKVMKYFQDNSYLSQDKMWEDDTLTVSKKGVTYTLIEKNEPLPIGYKFVCLPMASLSSEDMAAHKAPNMYLFVADSYGIRKVTINGEVI